jgi:hypothetical protein
MAAKNIRAVAYLMSPAILERFNRVQHIGHLEQQSG